MLYYSNFCPHSVRLLEYITKNNLINSINCICIDKRSRDINNNSMTITLANGTKRTLPPNVHSVPSLIRVSNNYTIIMGDDIIRHLQKNVVPDNKMSVGNDFIQNGEPLGTTLSNFSQTDNIQSVQFTNYGDDETIDGRILKQRDIFHYAPANHENNFINAPEDKYRKNKISGELTIEMLQEMRNSDIPNMNENPNLLGQLDDPISVGTGGGMRR